MHPLEGEEDDDNHGASTCERCMRGFLLIFVWPSYVNRKSIRVNEKYIKVYIFKKALCTKGVLVECGVLALRVQLSMFEPRGMRVGMISLLPQPTMPLLIPPPDS